jgi:hypothetical protein
MSSPPARKAGDHDDGGPAPPQYFPGRANAGTTPLQLYVRQDQIGMSANGFLQGFGLVAGDHGFGETERLSGNL